MEAAIVVPQLVPVGGLLVAVGAVVAPVFVVVFTGADSLVASEQRTEASTWVSTALNGGNALGTALAGLVLTLGRLAPFWFAACLTTLASGTALALHARPGDGVG